MNRKIKHPWEGRWTPPSVPVVVMASGGLDSTALLHLLYLEGLLKAIYHVNYGLRGEESNEDEDFLRNWAVAHEIPFHVDRVYLEKKNADLQNKARIIRYQGVTSYMASLGAQGYATAHHSGDAIETFLMNAARGTGLDGLVSLAKENNGLYRPLLLCTKEELLLWAQHSGWNWREDVSNQELQYTRNRIRLNVLPVYTEAMPQAAQGLAKTVGHLRQLQHFVQQQLTIESSGYLSEFPGYSLAKKLDWEILNHPHADLLLRFILQPWDQFDPEAVRILRTQQVGSRIEHAQWTLWSERGSFVLAPTKEREIESIPIDLTEEKSWNLSASYWSSDAWIDSAEWNFSLSQVARLSDGSMGSVVQPVLAPASSLCVLFWRPWTEGDWMTPLGMKGTKKVSDILTDAKVPSFLRKNVVVLAVSQEPGEIVWIPGIKLGASVAVSKGKVRFWKPTILYL